MEGGIHVRHYSSSEWLDYARHKVGSLEGSLMERHLAGCDKCATMYVNALEESLQMVDAPAGLGRTVMSAVEQCINERPGRSSQSRVKMLLRYTIAASFALILWQYGIFGDLSRNILSMREAPGFGDRMVGEVNSMFDYIAEKGDEIFNEK